MFETIFVLGVLAAGIIKAVFPDPKSEKRSVLFSTFVGGVLGCLVIWVASVTRLAPSRFLSVQIGTSEKFVVPGWIGSAILGSLISLLASLILFLIGKVATKLRARVEQE